MCRVTASLQWTVIHFRSKEGADRHGLLDWFLGSSNEVTSAPPKKRFFEEPH